MVGQKKLISKLTSYDISSLPKTMLFLGDSGCGKHTLANFISSHFEIGLDDITDRISLECIREIYTYSLPMFYIINMNEVSVKQQNVILKFIEEPPNLAHIILLCDSKAILIDTIINRCVTMEFEPYTNDELIEFVEDKENSDFILSVCKTPGQVKGINAKTLEDTNKLCEKIVTRLKGASFQNTLTVVNKMNYKDNYDKIDVNIFLNVLGTYITNMYVTTKNEMYNDMYDVLNVHKKMLNDHRLNKEYVIEHLMSFLWAIANK